MRAHEVPLVLPCPALSPRVYAPIPGVPLNMSQQGIGPRAPGRSLVPKVYQAVGPPWATQYTTVHRYVLSMSCGMFNDLPQSRMICLETPIKV